MPLSPIDIGIGFVVGSAVTAIAWQLSLRSVRNPERTRVSSVWGIQEVVAAGDTARIAAERIGDGVRVPAGSRVLLSAGATDAVPQEILHTCDVRTHADVHANYALGRDRALIFSGHIDARSLALWTMETDAVARLANDFDHLWATAEPYVESVKVAELLAGGEHRMVELTGVASELVEYRGRKMMRLNDDGSIIGISAPENFPDWNGATVKVTGLVHRENGAVFVEAKRAEKVPEAAARPQYAPAR